MDELIEVDARKISYLEPTLAEDMIVQFRVSKEEWEKIKVSKEWKKIFSENVSELPVKKTEDTLQSIDSTLKRIEELICKENSVKNIAEDIANQLTDSSRKWEQKQAVMNRIKKKKRGRLKWQENRKKQPIVFLLKTKRETG